jgi:predicted nucleotidyltransferase
MTIAPDIAVPDVKVVDICRRYQVRELSVFGSAARGEHDPDSDIDLLVDFEPDARVSLIEVSALVRELTSLLGRKVDIAIKPALKPRVREHVMKDAHVLYAA